MRGRNARLPCSIPIGILSEVFNDGSVFRIPVALPFVISVTSILAQHGTASEVDNRNTLLILNTVAIETVRRRIGDESTGTAERVRIFVTVDFQTVELATAHLRLTGAFHCYSP
jgi:hypothetical protein